MAISRVRFIIAISGTISQFTGVRLGLETVEDCWAIIGTQILIA